MAVAVGSEFPDHVTMINRAEEEPIPMYIKREQEPSLMDF